MLAYLVLFNSSRLDTAASITAISSGVSCSIFNFSFSMSLVPSCSPSNSEPKINSGLTFSTRHILTNLSMLGSLSPRSYCFQMLTEASHNSDTSSTVKLRFSLISRMRAPKAFLSFILYNLLICVYSYSLSIYYDLEIIQLLHEIIKLFKSVSLNGKQCNCGHSCKFQPFCLAAKSSETACWGPPQTRYFGPTWPEVVASLCSLFFMRYRSCSLDFSCPV